MATFLEAMAAAKEGKKVRWSTGPDKWCRMNASDVLCDSDNKEICISDFLINTSWDIENQRNHLAFDRAGVIKELAGDDQDRQENYGRLTDDELCGAAFHHAQQRQAAPIHVPRREYNFLEAIEMMEKAAAPRMRCLLKHNKSTFVFISGADLRMFANGCDISYEPSLQEIKAKWVEVT